MSVELAIFDMDGLILDSEPFWDIAESQVLISSGLPEHQYDSVHTTGFRISDTVAFWAEACHLAEPNDVIAQKIISTIGELIRQRGELMPGIRELLSSLQEAGVDICIASSSPMKLIDTVVEHFDLSAFVSRRFSADDCAYGKPNPEVFLNAIHAFGVAAENTLVFEDSVSGVIAAKASRSQCIAIPEPSAFRDPRFSIADFVCADAHDAKAIVETKLLRAFPRGMSHEM
jgi:HAD superfamily hydrolase (TIGR01509 family)